MIWIICFFFAKRASPHVQCKQLNEALLFVYTVHGGFQFTMLKWSVTNFSLNVCLTLMKGCEHHREIWNGNETRLSGMMLIYCLRACETLGVKFSKLFVKSQVACLLGTCIRLVNQNCYYMLIITLQDMTVPKTIKFSVLNTFSTYEWCRLFDGNLTYLLVWTAMMCVLLRGGFIVHVENCLSST